MFEKRKEKEFKFLDEMKINYEFNVINNNYELFFYTNHGKIIFYIPREYPFKPPEIFINTKYSKIILNNNYCKKILTDKQMPEDIIEKILSSHKFDTIYYPNDIEYNNEICFKKYLYDLTRRKTDSSNLYDILYTYDTKLRDYWSPAMFIKDIIKILINLTNSIQLKKEKYLIFT